MAYFTSQVLIYENFIIISIEKIRYCLINLLDQKDSVINFSLIASILEQKDHPSSACNQNANPSHVKGYLNHFTGDFFNFALLK